MSGEAVRSLIGFVAALGGTGLILAWFIALPLVGARSRRGDRRRIQAGTVAPIDELFHPVAYEAHIVWETQLELPATAPQAGDPGLTEGRTTILIQTADPDRVVTGA